MSLFAREKLSDSILSPLKGKHLDLIANLKDQVDFFDHINSTLKKPFVKHHLQMMSNKLLEANHTGEIKKVIDIGCGKGFVTHYIQQALNLPDGSVLGTDISDKKIELAQILFPKARFEIENFDKTITKNETFDISVCTEVLEHLSDPENLLHGLSKISEKYIFLSVPNEPYRSLTNLMLGKYISRLGNSPGHWQQWSKNGFETFINSQLPGWEVQVTPTGFWLMALCKKNCN